MLAHSTEEPAPTIAETVRTTLVENGFTLDIEEISDPTEIMTAISEQRLDLAIVEEPDQPFAGVKTLAPLYPSVLHVLHNRDLDPENFEILIRDANVYAGPPGGAAYRLLMQLADDFNLAGDDFQILENPWTVTPDVYFIFGGLLSPESIAQLGGYRLFSFAAEDDVYGATTADGIALKHHHLRPFVLPKGVYYRLGNEPILTLSIRSVLIAHEDLASELAYEISSALYVNAQEISLSYPLVTRELNENLQGAELILPLHDGTRRYLDRDRPGFIERNAEVIALYFTIVITLLSAAFALYRYRKQVRKDRVDVYLAQLLDVRRDMANADSDYVACRKQALKVQSDVLSLLIDERIAADASLIAFMSQSNQIINELDRLASDAR